MAFSILIHSIGDSIHCYNKLNHQINDGFVETITFWNFYFLKLLEGFGAKTVFHVKIDLSIAKIPLLCTDSQILRAFFSKSTFH